MAQNVDEIVVKFTTEGGQEVSETFKRTADAADQFHQRVGKASGALGDLRLKAEARVANNIGAIAQSMTAGASAGEVLATAVTRVSESFRGSLLFAGAATVGFALYQGFTRAGEAAIKLESDLLRLRRDTSLPGDFIGADQVSKNISDATGKLDELRSRYIREHTGFGGLFNQALRGALELRTRPGLEAKDAEEIALARKSGIDALSQQADKQLRLNDALRETLLGDERRAALLQVESAHMERLGQIAALEAKLGVTRSDARATEISRFNYENSLVNKKYDLLQKQLDLDKQIVEVEKDALAPSEQNLRVLELRAAALTDLANKTVFATDQERQAARNAAGHAQAQLHQAQLQTFLRGPATFVQEAFTARLNERLYGEARSRYLADELQRRAGLSKDVRGPGLKLYEDTVFGSENGKALYQEAGKTTPQILADIYLILFNLQQKLAIA